MKRIVGTKIATLVLLGCAAAMLAACGGSGGSVSTGLPRDKALNTLTPADLKTACLNTISDLATSDAVIRGGCAAGLSSLGVDACNAGLDACVTDAKTRAAKEANPATCDKPSTTDPTHFASCSATVAEFEDCLSELHDWVEERYASSSCEHPATLLSTAAASGPKCTALTSKCPGILGSDTQPAP